MYLLRLDALRWPRAMSHSLRTTGHSVRLMIKSGGVWREEVTAEYDLSLKRIHSWALSAAGTMEVWFYLGTSINPCFGLSHLKGSDVISTISIASLVNLLTSISLAASRVSFSSLILKNAKVRIVQKWPYSWRFTKPLTCSSTFSHILGKNSSVGCAV